MKKAAKKSGPKVSVGQISKLAKKIRKEGESWQAAIKRASKQLKKAI